mgnify:CR=1 FL=1
MFGVSDMCEKDVREESDEIRMWNVPMYCDDLSRGIARRISGIEEGRRIRILQQTPECKYNTVCCCNSLDQTSSNCINIVGIPQQRCNFKDGMPAPKSRKF